jgi:hypothetical protein
MEIKLSLKIANQELNVFENRSCTVNMTDITEDCTNVLYSFRLPKYLYDAVVDKAPWFMKEGIKRSKDLNDKTESYPAFKQTISFPSIIELRNKVEEISDYALMRTQLNRDADKKFICIKFNGRTQSCRTQYNHADAGMRTDISFQFFVCYMFKNSEHSLYPGIKNYYSRIRNSPTMSTSSNRNTQGIEVNEKFFHHVPNSSRSFEHEFVLIEWSEEREKFFQTIQDKFINLSEELSKFLNDLDESKVNFLLENFKQLSLSM